MVPSEQLIDDRHGDLMDGRDDAVAGDRELGVLGVAVSAPRVRSPWEATQPEAERAARVALRAQVGRLERELSGLVAGRFPHIAVDTGAATGAGAAYERNAGGGPYGGPRLLSLAELERERDRLALRVREVREHTAVREQLERDARELLQRMRAEPARYKLVRLPVAALGERGCGVWEVRPRLGLIGMLAGWWELKLSSGCPLAGGSRRGATPAPAGPSARRRRVSPERRTPRGRPVVAVRGARCAAPRIPRAWRPFAAASSADEHRFAAGAWPAPAARRGVAFGLGKQLAAGQRRALAASGGACQHAGERVALAVGHRADRLGLRHRHHREELAAAALTPAALTHQQVGDGHALGLPGALHDHLGDIDIARGHPPL
ncbi:MAG TPA: hypothetical protein VMS02_03895 [Solirubrobacteraceae bacterium]|nr:hypothetical protein [Solirubrobacteraceae bacterium]